VADAKEEPMKLWPDTCPTCGRPAATVTEQVWGYSVIIDSPEGAALGEGDAYVDAHTEQDAAGRLEVRCSKHHHWRAWTDGKPKKRQREEDEHQAHLEEMYLKFGRELFPQSTRFG
jgi:hypothetical protein